MAIETQTKLVGFCLGNKANYNATNYANHIWFDPTNKQILLNGIEYIPKKLSELVNDKNFITSITKAMVENVLTGNITSHTHTFASITSKPNTLLGYGITETDFFSFDTHISQAGVFFRNDYANNLLYAIDKRADVTATTFTNISSLFNLNYDSPQKIEAGDTEVILIENLNTVIPRLAYGYLYVQLYWGNYAENITVEVYSKNGGADYKWRALSGLNNIYLWTFNNVNINYDIDKIRIAIKAKSDTSCFVSQILFLGSRMSINNSPLITNYIPNTFLYDVTAPKYVVTGGTSSQFLKGDGSLDSNTYALSSALGNYLPLSGGTLTGALTCNGYHIDMNNDSGSRGYRGFFNQSNNTNRASGSHIFMGGGGYALGTNSVSIGYQAYAGIRNEDADKTTYPYIAWQWMPTAKFMVDTTNSATLSGGEYYGFPLLPNEMVQWNIGGQKVIYENSSSYKELLVVIKASDADTGLVFGGKTTLPYSASKTLIAGKYIVGSGECLKKIDEYTINGVKYYQVIIYTWDTTAFPTSYDFTQQVKVMCATKVNNSNYNGASSYASGTYSVASGSYSVASGYSSVASGYSSVASGNYSVASGNYSVASGYASVASGYASVASGYYSVASGYYSVASGYSSVASGNYSVASGYSSVASGIYSVASGAYSVASGNFSVASGYSSVASGDFSVVLARNGETMSSYQTIVGKFNAKVAGLFIIGNGTSDTARSNAFVVDDSGNVTAKYFSGYANAIGGEGIKVYATNSNEINFGGTSSSTDIYFGYRSMDSRPTPTTYNFGKGTATIQAAAFTGNAATATALTSSAGSATQPIYFSNGKPVACTYTLGKSVPSNAVFTDTTYSVATASADGLMSAAMFNSEKVSSISVRQGAVQFEEPIRNHNIYVTYDKDKALNSDNHIVGGDVQIKIPNATKDYDGSMSYTDKRKLDGISPYAPKKVVALRLSFNADATVTVISGGGDYDMTQDAELMGSKYVEQTSTNILYLTTFSLDLAAASTNTLNNLFRNSFVKFSFMGKSTTGISDFTINVKSNFYTDTLEIQFVSTKQDDTCVVDCVWEFF